MMSTQSNQSKQLDPDTISNAPGSGDALDECVRGSRLLGADKSLVLHGGGNTSVKAPWTDITGEVIDALYVKGSGWDLATIERAGFTPLPIKSSAISTDPARCKGVLLPCIDRNVACIY